MHSQKITLKQGTAIPILGFGTWKLRGEQCVEAITHALDIGYRHIDTADVYENHQAVGQALQQSDVPRSEIFLTSKVHPMKGVRSRDINKTLPRVFKELQTDYLDLLLLHWPDRSVSYEDSFNALEQWHQKGFLREFGVSNYTAHHLQDVFAATNAKVAVNQVEYHLTLANTELKKFCDEHGIVLTAYSPLGRGQDTDEAVVQKIANAHTTSPAAVLLRWLIDQNIVVIPKASSKAHIAENYSALTLRLTENETTLLNNVARNDNRVVKPRSPEFSDFDY